MASSACAQLGRVEALSLGREGLKLGRGWGGALTGEGAPAWLLEGVQVGADLGEDTVHRAFGVDL